MGHLRIGSLTVSLKYTLKDSIGKYSTDNWNIIGTKLELPIRNKLPKFSWGKPSQGSSSFIRC